MLLRVAQKQFGRKAQAFRVAREMIVTVNDQIGRVFLINSLFIHL